MQAHRLRDFRDANIRGPDFVWAATGAALEAFGRHPVVKRTDAPGAVLTVAEFLRRMVVAFVVNRLFAVQGEATATLDDPTTYPPNDGSPPPLIDCVHRTMRQWKTGEQSRVDGYLEAHGLWRNDLFKQVVQAGRAGTGQARHRRACYA